MSQSIQIGDKVIAVYKSGEYYGEITAISPVKSKVKILAVRKHPTQGDLHHPSEVEGVMFHQRRALAYQEQANIPNNHIQIYSDSIPDYSESLKNAIQGEIASLQKVMRWTQKSLEELQSLHEDYFPKS